MLLREFAAETKSIRLDCTTVRPNVGAVCCPSLQMKGAAGFQPDGPDCHQTKSARIPARLTAKPAVQTKGATLHENVFVYGFGVTVSGEGTVPVTSIIVGVLAETVVFKVGIGVSVALVVG